MYGYIYKITFPENSFGLIGEPFYIGQKKGDFNPYYWGSGVKIRDYFKSKKLNARNCSESELLKNNIILKREILRECDSQDELNKAEFDEIDKYLNNKLCLNLCAGGSQPFVSEELRKKISEKTKEAMWRPEIREKYLNSLNTRFTEKTYKKMKESAIKNQNGKRLNEFNAKRHKEITNDSELREKRRKKKAAKTGIKVICIETGVIYDSLSNAFTQTKIYHIKDAAEGRRSHAGGFHWILV